MSWLYYSGKEIDSWKDELGVRKGIIKEDIHKFGVRKAIIKGRCMYIHKKETKIAKRCIYQSVKS